MIESVVLTSWVLLQTQPVEPPPNRPLTHQEIIDALSGAPPGAEVEAAQPVGDPFPSGLPLEWLGPLSDNLRFTIDLSGRFEYDTGRQEWSTTQFYGFDLFKVFSDEDGDLGTLVLQGFATRIDNNPAPPWFFDGPTDWEFVYRIFNYNAVLIERGLLNLKIGHFEMPFGLESQLDTNGTLRQVGTARDLGIKADWGVTLNGVTDGLEYEFGLGRGSGNEWHSAGSPYVLTGRVGLDRQQDWWVGASYFLGELYRPGTTIERRRVGVDAGMHFDQFTVMGQVSGGDDGADTDALFALCELDWKPPSEDWLLYGQFVIDRTRTNAVGWQGPVQSVLGAQWALDNHWTLSAQWVQNYSPVANGSREAVLQFQARYRF